MPPVATTGSRTASATAGTSETRPTILCSAAAASKAARCPPASAPCATITSAPAASAATASATVLTAANQEMPLSFRRATKAGGNRPITEETAGGAAASSASHWASKSGGRASPASGTPAVPTRR